MLFFVNNPYVFVMFPPHFTTNLYNFMLSVRSLQYFLKYNLILIYELILKKVCHGVFFKPYMMIWSVPKRTHLVLQNELIQKHTTLFYLNLKYLSINGKGVDRSSVISYQINYLGLNQAKLIK